MAISPPKVNALCGLAGAALPLAFAPFHWWWLAPVCYASLLLAWSGATPGQAFVRGAIFGAAQFLFGVYWIYISVHEIADAPLWIAIGLMLGLVAVMAMYPALVGWVTARLSGIRARWLWLGIVPATWVIAEWIRGWFLSGFGWLSPGYAQTDSWLIGFAPVLGVLGVSWAVFVIAGSLALAVRGQRQDRIAAGAVVVALFGIGFLASRIAWTEPQSNQISAALIQGAVPQEDKWKPEQLPLTMDLYRRLTADALGTQLIVWPEAAVPQLYENLEPWLDGIERMTASAGSRVMLGMLKYHESGPQNALFTLGEPESTYIKRHLVPYGERFPMPDFMRPWFEAIDLVLIDTHPGDPGQPPIDLLGQRIAVTICYEDVFGAEQLHSFPDATLLVNVSNDAWFGNSIAPHQHLQIARMRSAEVRRAQLRSTNTGISAVIDPYGRVTARSPQFEPDVLRANVSGFAGTTPYILWGNWGVLVLAGIVLGSYWASTKFTIRPGT